MKINEVILSIGSSSPTDHPQLTLPGVKEKVTSVLEQLNHIHELAPDQNSRDANESKRHTKLVVLVQFTIHYTIPILPFLSSLMGVEVELHSLLDHLTNDDCAATMRDQQMVYNLAEKIRNATHQYQVGSKPCDFAHNMIC